jgi:hypothetical protein
VGALADVGFPWPDGEPNRGLLPSTVAN